MAPASPAMALGFRVMSSLRLSETQTMYVPCFSQELDSPHFYQPGQAIKMMTEKNEKNPRPRLCFLAVLNSYSDSIQFRARL